MYKLYRIELPGAVFPDDVKFFSFVYQIDNDRCILAAERLFQVIETDRLEVIGGQNLLRTGFDRFLNDRANSGRSFCNLNVIDGGGVCAHLRFDHQGNASGSYGVDLCFRI